MVWVMHLIRAVGENENESGISCRWLLTCGMGPMAAAIVFLILWVKALMVDLKESMKERVNDLKDHYRAVKKD